MASLANFFSHMFSKNENITEAELIKKPGTGNLKPDRNAHKPDLAWSKLKNQQKMANVASLKPGMPMREDRIRFVCISDTHALLERGAPLEIPQGDVLIHAGDLTMSGEPREVTIVDKYLGTLPHKHKILIAGNHDMTFDSEFMANTRKSRFFTFDSNDSYQQDLAKYGVKHIQKILTNCTYLEDSMVQVYGINIDGSPWTVGSGSWGFQRARGSGILSIWNQIPTNTDILVTHMPPLGYGDSVQGTLSVSRLKPLFGIPPIGLEDHVGCVDLLRTVQSRVKPTLHVYGHIHEGYGMRTDGTTTFVNASTCTLKYRPINPPLVFDFPLPPGVTKQDFSDSPLKWVIQTECGEDYELVGENEAIGAEGGCGGMEDIDNRVDKSTKGAGESYDDINVEFVDEDKATGAEGSVDNSDCDVDKADAAGPEGENAVSDEDVEFVDLDGTKEIKGQ